MKKLRFTVHDRVLLALACAADHTQAAVPYEEIVLNSWRMFPERFSLRRHPEFPDSNDQNKSLYGPLKKDGLVLSLGDMTFRLTDAGIDRAIALGDVIGRIEQKSAVDRVSRDEERLLRSVATSEARAKWSRGQRDDIVDFDARSFFGITAATPDQERCVRVQTAKDAIERAEYAKFSGASELRELFEFLTEEFPEALGAGTA